MHCTHTTTNTCTLFDTPRRHEVHTTPYTHIDQIPQKCIKHKINHHTKHIATDLESRMSHQSNTKVRKKIPPARAPLSSTDLLQHVELTNFQFRYGFFFSSRFVCSKLNQSPHWCILIHFTWWHFSLSVCAALVHSVKMLKFQK